MNYEAIKNAIYLIIPSAELLSLIRIKTRIDKNKIHYKTCIHKDKGI
jgi:hypothetical protein